MDFKIICISSSHSLPRSISMLPLMKSGQKELLSSLVFAHILYTGVYLVISMNFHWMTITWSSCSYQLFRSWASSKQDITRAKQWGSYSATSWCQWYYYLFDLRSKSSSKWTIDPFWRTIQMMISMLMLVIRHLHRDLSMVL